MTDEAASASAGASEWSAEPVIDWRLRSGRRIEDPQALLSALCSKVVAAGSPLDRVSVFIGTLHPQYFGIQLRWHGEQTELFPGTHGLESTGEEVVVSESVASHAPGPWKSLGRHTLRGVSREIEVFAFAARTTSEIAGPGSGTPVPGAASRFSGSGVRSEGPP